MKCRLLWFQRLQLITGGVLMTYETNCYSECENLCLPLLPTIVVVTV